MRKATPKFWYRENPTEKLGGGIIHMEDCPLCQHGQMKKTTWIMGKSIVWCGPFESIQLLVKYVRLKALPLPKICDCVLRAEIGKWQHDYIKGTFRVNINESEHDI